MEAKTHKKPANRTMRVSKAGTASEAIGQIQHDQDVFILTFGQFSLIDALVAIIDQIGPANVAISTWTAADAHLEATSTMIESADILDFKLIVDRSFETRQPEYCYHMRRVFGDNCIRHIRSHAKFMLIRNDNWNIVVRTSMNLNENPRLENIEISESLGFANFFQAIVDDVFCEVNEGQKKSDMLDLKSIQESLPFKEINAKPIKRSNLNEPRYSHTLKKL